MGHWRPRMRSGFPAIVAIVAIVAGACSSAATPARTAAPTAAPTAALLRRRRRPRRPPRPRRRRRKPLLPRARLRPRPPPRLRVVRFRGPERVGFGGAERLGRRGPWLLTRTRQIGRDVHGRWVGPCCVSVDALQPLTASGDSFFINKIWKHLVTYSINTETNSYGVIIPALAASWETSADGLPRWTFHLQPGVKWHDGTDFTSADVKFSLEECVNPKAGGCGFSAALAGMWVPRSSPPEPAPSCQVSRRPTRLPS